MSCGGDVEDMWGVFCGRASSVWGTSEALCDEDEVGKIDMRGENETGGCESGKGVELVLESDVKVKVLIV